MRLFITEKSRQMKKLLQNERQEANNELLAGFTVEEKVLLKRFLKDMV